MIVIKTVWHVAEFADIFPEQIRPDQILGVSTLCQLRRLSIFETNLAVAQDFMLNACMKADGTHGIMSYSNSLRLRDILESVGLCSPSS